MKLPPSFTMEFSAVIVPSTLFQLSRSSRVESTVDTVPLLVKLPPTTSVPPPLAFIWLLLVTVPAAPET